MLSPTTNRRLALVVGIVLPLAETLRRSGDLGTWWLSIDDWVIGAALIAGALAARTGREPGRRALAGAWGVAAGMGYYSFAGHLVRFREPDVSGLPGWLLASAIGIGWCIALYAFASAILGPADEG